MSTAFSCGRVAWIRRSSRPAAIARPPQSDGGPPTIDPRCSMSGGSPGEGPRPSAGPPGPLRQRGIEPPADRCRGGAHAGGAHGDVPRRDFTGPLGREAVAEVFASADLFVFPSRTDTAGNVVLEAQASGLPVVVSNAGGPQETCGQADGVVCPGVDAESWADHVGPLLASTSLRESMGRAARDYAVSRRWDAALAPLYQAYREVGARGRRVA